ncbi:SIR2 family protein [candidate division KSB1 bacterium]|nr:SIR2 family protein [candidate division KSB1 bacterium]
MNAFPEALPTDIDWDTLVDELKKQTLVPFLGAGASLGCDGATGLPTGGSLAEMLAQECKYPGKDKFDLLRVAQYYAFRRGEMRLRSSLNEKLSLKEVKPGEIHNLIASWPVNVVLTTNFDNLVERAFSKRDKDPAKALYDRKGDQKEIDLTPTIDKPLVYKLHGSLENLDSMIVTEDNYIDFLISLIEGNPKVPDIIKNVFRRCSILFIGYGLKDWNIRVLLRYFRKPDIPSFAIQRDMKALSDAEAQGEWESTVLYWRDQKVSVYNCDALDFVRELDRRFREGSHA